MDAGSIVNNALGGLLGSLALLILVWLVKRIRLALKQRATQPKGVLDQTFRESEAYKEIVRSRHSYLFIGYLFLGSFLLVLAAFIAVAIELKTLWIGWNWLLFLGLLLGEVPFALYLGYLPITTQEVELTRQKQRMRTFKQAQGRKPYGYIFFFIVFPPLLWLLTVTYFTGLIQLLLSPSPFHLTAFWRVGGVILIVLIGLVFTYFFAKITYRSIKHLKYVSLQKQRELRTQLVHNEFEQ